MLNFPKRIMIFLLSLLLLIPGAAVTAFAEYDTGNGNIVQSGKSTEEDCTFYWKLYENGLLYVDSETPCGEHYNHEINLNSQDADKLIKKVFIGTNISDISTISAEYYPGGSSLGLFVHDFPNLESIETSENNLNYASYDGILYNKDLTEIEAYPVGKLDETYIIPETVKYIDLTYHETFSIQMENKPLYEPHIKNIVIPDTDIEIYKSKEITTMPKLENIIVSENNPNYSSKNGILYDKNGDTLLYCPKNYQNSTVEINPGTKEIKTFAFSWNNTIELVKIPASVTSISSAAFNVCSSIKTVIFENGSGTKDLRIKRNAFFSNSALDNINLTGSRIYSIDSDAFIGSAYAENESNYENGVLYLNDILLSIDDLSIPDDYTVKDGTTTIADNSFLLKSLTGEHVKYRETYKLSKECNKNVKAVNVTLPDSVTNIGVNSIHSFNNIPENIFRIGAPELFLTSVLLSSVDDEDFRIENQGIADKAITEIKDILSNYNQNCSIDDIIEMFKNNSEWVSIDINNQTINMFPVSWIYDVIPSICRLKDGTVGFADGYYLKYSPGCNSLFGNETEFSKSTILPTSFNNLSKSTPLSLHPYDFENEIFSYSTDFPNPFTEEKCVTFLNKDCCIYDDADTINKYVTICGYKGSTAEAYALKYGRKFVDISDCRHEKTCPNFSIEPTCGKDGYSGDVYCQYCGEFIKEGEVIPATGEHDFSSPERIKGPTCTEPGEEKITCYECGYSETQETEPYGHDFIITISHFDGTCTEDGYVIKMCPICHETQKEITSIATGHVDENNDGCCDSCDKKITPDCSCICHKSNAFSRFFYKLFRILWKIFRINKSCDCGAVHY